MNDYGIDGHKLMLHPRRVAAWMDGADIAPIYMEISPCGHCNHRCVFCGLDFMGYKPRLLDPDLLLARLGELAGLGLKSVMFAGEGEPLLHRRFVEIARGSHALGLDVSLTTNGVRLDAPTLQALLPVMRWIKVSFNAGTPATYARLHGTREQDFWTTLANLGEAVRLKRQRGYAVTLGMQSLLLPENEAEMPRLAAIARETGLDYLVVKPYSQHPKSLTDTYAAVRYGDLGALDEELARCATDTFRVIFRRKAMSHWDSADKGYGRCLGLPFWSYLDAGGTVWGCSVHLTDPRFAYGNIAENTFREIWSGRARRRNLDFVANAMDASACRVNCRLDEINRYLWRLRHPQPHDNFI